MKKPSTSFLLRLSNNWTINFLKKNIIKFIKTAIFPKNIDDQQPILRYPIVWTSQELVIWRILDGLGFLRYDFYTQEIQSWDKIEGDQLWILVFLDESNHDKVDKNYTEKWGKYKNNMFDDRERNLNIDHRWVSDKSLLSWSDFLCIAEYFFKVLNETWWNYYDKITVNDVSQKSVIQWFLKNNFVFRTADQMKNREWIIANDPNYELRTVSDNWYGFSADDMIYDRQTNSFAHFQMQKRL